MNRNGLLEDGEIIETCVAESCLDFIPFTTDGELDDIALMTSSKAPWQGRRILGAASSSFISLHNEIIAFCDFIAPTKDEMTVRKKLVADLTSIITEVFPTASIHVFGSQFTTILTPTSDLDLAVLDIPCGDNGNLVSRKLLLRFIKSSLYIFRSSL
jgi:hypothetical protein